MEIIYDNKLSEKEVLKKAEQQKITLKFPPNQTSLLFEGDNFVVLASLLEKFKGKIDLIYIDPPFNTSQDFYFSESKANSISYSKNDILAYSDNLTKDEYLEFIRERLILLRELLSDKGSIYLHIDYKIGHYVKVIMDEVFGEKNFKNDITRIKSNPKNFYRKAYGNEKDMILFYARDYKNNIWNDIKVPLNQNEIIERFSKVDYDGRRYTTIPLHAPGETKTGNTGKPWRNIQVPKGRHWRTDPLEFDKMDAEGKIEWSSTGNPRIKKYADEHKGKKIQDIWTFKDPQNPTYPTQKNFDMICQIIKQSSSPTSIILDCFAGSGVTLKGAFKLNRTWIGIDNSVSAIDVIRKNDLGNYTFFNLNTNEMEYIVNKN